MKCPTCDADTRVVYTNSKTDVVRRRECFNLHRFSTIEIIHDSDADKRERRRVHLDAMKKASDALETERKAIREATGTLQSIADQFGRSVSYIWTIKRRDNR